MSLLKIESISLVQICLFCSLLPLSTGNFSLLLWLAEWYFYLDVSFSYACTHRFSFYFKSQPGKLKRDQTFEKLMQALSSKRFWGLRSRFFLSGAVWIKGVLSDFSSLSQNHSHRCTTVVTAEVTLYCTTSSPQHILFAMALKNCRLLLLACM